MQSVLLTCMYGHPMHALCGQRQKKAWDPLKLELWAVVSCHVDATSPAPHAFWF